MGDFSIELAAAERLATLHEEQAELVGEQASLTPEIGDAGMFTQDLGELIAEVSLRMLGHQALNQRVGLTLHDTVDKYTGIEADAEAALHEFAQEIG